MNKHPLTTDIMQVKRFDRIYDRLTGKKDKRTITSVKHEKSISFLSDMVNKNKKASTNQIVF